MREKPRGKALIVLGPGHSVNTRAPDIQKKRNNYEVLAFQRTYPNCKERFGIEPDYWTAADPYGFIEGLEYIIDKKEQTGITILVPSIFKENTATYRKYCGTTPLLRQKNGWEHLQELLKKSEQFCQIKIVPTTTTKYIALHSDNSDLKNNIFGADPFYRFMHREVIIGSVPFDSESVIGTTFKWGLENKITSSVLPICYYLQSTEIYIIGFDLFGPRFYSNDSRHPWNDESQREEAVKFPLSIVEEWSRWSKLHGMSIYSASSPQETLLSTKLETREI